MRIILLSLYLLLAVCAANRIEIDLSKKYVVPLPEKKLNVHLENFYKNSSKWDNDWVIYSEKEDSKYSVDFATDTENAKSNIRDLSREFNV